MERIRKVLRLCDDDDGFIFTIGEGAARIEVKNAWLELYYDLAEMEYWTYARQFHAGRNPDAVKDGLRLSFMGSNGGKWRVRVAIRPKDAEANYRTGDVGRVAEFVERDFKRFLQPLLPR